MNRQEKIEAIYEKIADKTLSFGCKFKLKSGAITIATGEPSGPFITCLFFQQTRLENIEKIIGNPVMLGDIMDFIYDEEMGKFENDGIEWILNKLQKLFIVNLRKPIENQSDECVDFVFDLIF